MTDNDIRDPKPPQEGSEEQDAQNMQTTRKAAIKKEVWSWVRTLGIAVIAALIVRTFFFTPAIVRGISMQDTLYTGQMMAVIKSSYWFDGPERGEVVFCRYPGWTEDCVKRVIGLPGERIRIEDSVVYIGDVPLEEPYLSRPQTGDFPEILIPEGSYFVMGDNRSRSTDSRDVGPLEMSQIEGHCVAVFWPISDWKVIR